MAHIFMQHQIADYDTWRPVFDGDAGGRAAGGVKDVAVLRGADDANSVWMVFEADPALIEPMMADPDRGAQMQAAGVLSEPRVWVAPPG
jgi:hypothetical protein